MKQLLFILFFILPFTVNSQIYNKVDTTWTLSYQDVSKIRDTIKVLENKEKLLKDEIDLLIFSNVEYNKAVKKLQVRDSACTLIIEKYKEMDDIMREKVFLSNDIINNYKILLFSAEDQIRAENKKRKKAELWKNIYKYSIPLVAAITSYVILK